MKLSLRRPAVDTAQQVLAAAKHEPPSLVPTHDFATAPPGFHLGSTIEDVGSGTHDYERARELVKRWAFLPAWARALPDGAHQTPGETVLIVVRTLGVWSILAARILETIHDDEGKERGFVYAALTSHVAHGYERFVVAYEPADQRVTFEITAVARPATWVLRLGRPLFTGFQRRFRRACMHQLRESLRADAQRSARPR